MNTFGRIFRVSMLGESHGECVGVLIDGVPAGIPLSPADFDGDLERRRSGARGTTPRKESDVPQIRSGVFEGKATGAPVLIVFANTDTDSAAYERLRTTPRPGHADFVALKKFGGFSDYRGGGHFSGRLTAGIVAAGVVAKKVIAPAVADAKLVEAGGSGDVAAAVEMAMNEGDSVGGVVECRVNGLPAGLGEPFFDSAESLLAHAIFAIPAIKGIEFGAGFAGSRMRGSELSDDIIDVDGRTRTNHEGGINAGITNGNEVLLKVAVKPTSSIKKGRQTVDMATGQHAEIRVEGRHDACIALRVPVVVEAVAAIVFADLLLLEQKVPRVARRG
ncbi:MAG: chorismate synthase [Acidobacteria bacterium]|nr:chorismate synthase [Acidobacteriota bacterium]